MDYVWYRWHVAGTSVSHHLMRERRAIKALLCDFVAFALFYFNEQPILCKFSRQILTSEWGGVDKAALSLHDSVSRDSVRHLLVRVPCSGTLSLLELHKFPEFFTINVLMTSYLCSWHGYFYGSGTLDSPCVQS